MYLPYEPSFPPIGWFSRSVASAVCRNFLKGPDSYTSNAIVFCYSQIESFHFQTEPLHYEQQVSQMNLSFEPSSNYMKPDPVNKSQIPTYQETSVIALNPHFETARRHLYHHKKFDSLRNSYAK